MRDRRPLLCVILALALRGSAAAAEPGAGTLVVLNKSDATASLIDLGTGLVAATLPTGVAPHELAVSPGGRRAVVSNYGTAEAPGSTLTVINIPDATVLRTIDLGEYRRPHGLAFLADGRRLLVTSEASKSLLTVDVEAGSVVSKVVTDQETSHMVVVTPDGHRAFVANIGSGSVTAIDLEKGQRLASVPTAPGAEGITITPDGRQVWVTNRASDSVSIVDASSLELTATIASKSFPIRARATPDGRHVLVSNARSGDIAVFDVATRTEVRRIALNVRAADTAGRLMAQFGDSSVPIGIVIRPDGRRAWVAHANADIITVLDLEKWEAVGTLRAGREPDGMGYSPLAVRAVPGETGERLRDRLRAEGLEAAWVAERATPAGSAGVVAWIRGSEWPEQGVLLGTDLSAAGGDLLVAVARDLSAGARDGWRPRRSVLLAAGSLGTCDDNDSRLEPLAGDTEVMACLTETVQAGAGAEASAAAVRAQSDEMRRRADADFPVDDFAALTEKLLAALDTVAAAAQTAFTLNPPPAAPVREAIADLRNANAEWRTAVGKWREKPETGSGASHRLDLVVRALAPLEPALRQPDRLFAPAQVAARAADRGRYIGTLLGVATRVNVAASRLRTAIALLEAPAEKLPGAAPAP
jgi:YVTN family beta-propeller protein